MADFRFLRLHEADLRRYLPKFLARDAAFRDLLKTHSREHEQLRLFLSGFAQQFFIEAATWGLSSWEDVWESNPPNGADAEFWRALIKAKMIGRQPTTKASLEHLINVFTKGHDAHVEEDTAPGCFQIHFPSVILWQKQMEEMLDATVPAHLTYSLHFDKDKTSTAIYYGTTLALHNRYVASPIAARDASHKVRLCAGGAMSLYKKHVASPIAARDASHKVRVAIGAAMAAHKKYEIRERST
ncbi:putative phage tail protein [uncultured Mitsuokella sp.]|uniref:putative phage tail protein n=1 Tax=uncultured Mitsuokella sp. TaxID=453120 RepID=UPI002638CB5E|nr:putative phage tail protein [uncultured Mitsuokella sp.]